MEYMREELYCVCDIFLFNDTATTEIYTLSLHDALPISPPSRFWQEVTDVCRRHGILVIADEVAMGFGRTGLMFSLDRKSTRLNSSHANISYAVFCLKKKQFSPLLLTTLSISSLIPFHLL